MSITKKALYCFSLYILLNIISLPMLFLIGDFKDGFIAIQQNSLAIVSTIFLLLLIFSGLKIKRIRYAIIMGFLIQYIIAFRSISLPLDYSVIEGFFLYSYLLNPLSFYIFRLLPLIFITNFLLLKLFPIIAPFNLLIVAILILIFNIVCWYFLGLLIEKCQLLITKTVSR